MSLFTIAITVPVILGLYGVILVKLNLVRWNCLSNGRLAESKNNRKCHNVSPKSGRCRLREVIAYERFQLKCFDPKNIGILETCTLAGGGCLREVVAQGGNSIVTVILHIYLSLGRRTVKRSVHVV